MLDHDEERALAEIEARLHDEDPDLSLALRLGVAPRAAPTSLRQAVGRTAAVVAGAVALSTVATVVAGPDIGALVTVVGLSLAFLYGWQALRVCRGTRPDGRR